AETARKMWSARKLVLAYLKADETDRAKVLADFASAKNAVDIDELAQIISLIPPPLAETKTTEEMVERKPERGISYMLKLPPEYHHGRSYPVLILLHNTGERPRKMIDRFAEQAKEHGYILAAPSWPRGGLGSDYTYSADDHEVVLKTLRDLRLHYNVDSDR